MSDGLGGGRGEVEIVLSVNDSKIAGSEIGGNRETERVLKKTESSGES
jgi:hypothetical protein